MSKIDTTVKKNDVSYRTGTVFQHTGFVYLWINLINGKQYIGSHWGTETDSYRGSGVLFKKSVRKHGILNFRRIILEYYNGTSRIELFEIEEMYLKRLNVAKNPKYYNMTNSSGGYLWSDARRQAWSKLKTGTKQSLESIKKRTSKLMGRNHPMWTGHYVTPKGIFDTQKEAATANNISYRTVSYRCKSGKYQNWRFIKNESTK